MNLVDATTVTFIHPSHVDIARNERADVLAAKGRKSSPLYATVKHPPPPTPTQNPMVSSVAQREEGNIVGECLHTIELRLACESNVATPLSLPE